MMYVCRILVKFTYLNYNYDYDRFNAVRLPMDAIRLSFDHDSASDDSRMYSRHTRV